MGQIQEWFKNWIVQSFSLESARWQPGVGGGEAVGWGWGAHPDGRYVLFGPQCFLKVGPKCQLNSHKNLDFWHVSWKMERPGNMKWYSCPAMISRLWVATFEWVTRPQFPQASYLLPDLAHSTRSHLLGPVGTYTCASALGPFLPYAVEDITEEVAFEQGLERGLQLLRGFTSQRNTSVDSRPLCSYCLCFLHLSAGWLDVFAICVLESRQLKFPFGLCHLPGEGI